MADVIGLLAKQIGPPRLNHRRSGKSLSVGGSADTGRTSSCQIAAQTYTGGSRSLVNKRKERTRKWAMKDERTGYPKSTEAGRTHERPHETLCVARDKKIARNSEEG